MAFHSKSKRGWPAWFLASALASSVAMAEETVACLYTYGGETSVLTARPAASPYSVPSIPIGSYFRFQVVFQTAPADLASIKIYTYANQDGGPVLIHQATYPYPPPGSANAPFGFTGQHFVYEPIRDSELQYWCRLEQINRENR